jgi:hypothetical protein
MARERSDVDISSAQSSERGGGVKRKDITTINSAHAKKAKPPEWWLRLWFEGTILRLLADLGGFLGFDGGFLALVVGAAAAAFDGFVVLSAHISLYFDFVFRFCEATMIIRCVRFNSYFCLAALAVAALLTGCTALAKKKNRPFASLRVHMQVQDTRMDHDFATVLRDQPVRIPIEKQPFLTEYNIADARVTESQGVLAIVIQLERKGTWTLENITSSNPGKNFAIFAQWGEKSEFTRWLAAPAIKVRITDGILAFTPDASREECESIVKGWLNLAKEEKNYIGKQEKK